MQNSILKLVDESPRLKIDKKVANVTITPEQIILKTLPENKTLRVEQVEIKLFTRGFQGPVGPQGSSGDLHYIFNQLSPLTTWNIVHNLNKYPSVTIVDSADSVVIGNITYINPNILTVSFSSGFAGTAYLN